MLTALVKCFRKVRDGQRKLCRPLRMTAISSLLSNESLPDTKVSESEFDALQRKYPKRPEYGYDHCSLVNRANRRFAEIYCQANVGCRRLRILEIGAGDGMLGVLLATAGHNVTLCDFEDWRSDAAKHLHFIAADCCLGIPFDTGNFDLVCSFNSFEHFHNPRYVFDEAMRVTKAGGLMHFDFGPLYCSPWGLHAYRSLRMPYPQFLFSQEFIEAKLTKLGIWDLGKQRTELQNLNMWKPSQFTNLWNRDGCEVSNYQEHTDESHLKLIRRYPNSFSGRGLTYRDVTCSALSVTIRKL
jgi:SAM-dependent methyltransferase